MNLHFYVRLSLLSPLQIKCLNYEGLVFISLQFNPIRLDKHMNFKSGTWKAHFGLFVGAFSED